jgi:hypothetical protein
MTKDNAYYLKLLKEQVDEQLFKAITTGKKFNVIDYTNQTSNDPEPEDELLADIDEDEDESAVEGGVVQNGSDVELENEDEEIDDIDNDDIENESSDGEFSD